MKKSTLITTIAMIVVVVVALSTATYAWFSSGSTTTVEGAMTTEAKKGWILYGGTVGTPLETENHVGETTITYTSSSPELHLLNELYSPTAALSDSYTVEGLTGTYTQKTFYRASQEGTGLKEKATINAAASYQHQEEANGSYFPNLNCIRIINQQDTQTASDDLTLTIYVYVTGYAQAGNNGQQALMAGKRFCTYIATDAAANSHFNTRYYWGGVGESSVATRNSKIVPKEGVTYSNVEGDTVEEDSALATTGYTLVSAANTKLGATSVALNNGDAYYSITVNLGAVNKNAARNIVFYSWFDGWALDNTASGGSVNVLYAFS